MLFFVTVFGLDYFYEISKIKKMVHFDTSIIFSLNKFLVSYENLVVFPYS